jgi:NAD(P)-dependent dehydrogenase (short-subunit alcohol dehydrogenase family)
VASRVFRDDLLAGKVAIVTGGGTGIGAAIARELLALGAKVVIASRKEANVRPAAEHLGCDWRVCDVRDRGQVDALVASTLEKHGRIDILVNNGGGQFFSPAQDITPNGWDAVVATNLTGQWNVTRAVAKAWMLEHGGRIVSITMLAARNFGGMTHSVAARAGVEAMTRNLAVEWAPNGIAVNAVAPGYIASSGLTKYPAGVEFAKQMQRHVPMKRLGHVDDVANMVAFLCGPGGDYVTGQTINVCGGRSIWGDHWPIPDPEPLPDVVIPKEPWDTGEG